ncbi:hypothetical protein [Streptomyces sp. 6N223]|uniref:hypothetical protein n=1 Tax=Streptomyces sp. 6N223 TaxID=3457412 RepID=UPI003FD4F207
MRHPRVRSVLAALSLTAGALTAVAAAPAQAAAPASAPVPLVTKISHAEATAMFQAAGITWSSSGNCSDRDNPTCTSFEQLNLESAQGAQTLKSASGCALNITGGTETGHAGGTYSHWNGYKLDYSLSGCLDGYITGSFAYIGERGDGAPLYESGSGNIYALESNHWDVTYYNCGGC